MRKKLFGILAIVIVQITMLAGCGFDLQGRADYGAGAVGVLAGAEGKVLNIAAQDPQVPLDMQLNTYSLLKKMTDNIVETLITPGEDGTQEPTLLTRMPELSADNLTYSFTLKEGVKFHNGEILTSNDVKYSLERLVRKVKMGSLLEKVEGYDAFDSGQAESLAGIEIIDNTHFNIRLSSVYTPFLSVLSTPYAAIYPARACEEAGEDWGLLTLIGTGPFALDHYTGGVDCTIRKFSGYHGTPAKLDIVNFKFISDYSAQILEYQKGTVDMLEIDSTLYAACVEDEQLKKEMYSYQRQGSQFLLFNVKEIPDVRVREAITYAIDRKAICEEIMHGMAVPAASFIPRGIIGYDESAEVYEYNPDKARRLLTEAGHAKGYTLEITANSNYPANVKIAEAMQTQAVPAGITVIINQVDNSTWTDMKKNGKVACGFASWYVDYGDPDSMLYPVSDGRVDVSSSFWHHDEFRKLMNDGVKTADAALRQKIYQKADHILTREEYAVAPVFNETNFYLVKPYVSGVKITDAHRTFLVHADIHK